MRSSRLQECGSSVQDLCRKLAKEARATGHGLDVTAFALMQAWKEEDDLMEARLGITRKAGD